MTFDEQLNGNCTRLDRVLFGEIPGSAISIGDVAEDDCDTKTSLRARQKSYVGEKMKFMTQFASEW